MRLGFRLHFLRKINTKILSSENISVFKVSNFTSKTYLVYTYWKNCHNALLEPENGLQSSHICKPAEDLKYLIFLFDIWKFIVFWHQCPPPTMRPPPPLLLTMLVLAAARPGCEPAWDPRVRRDRPAPGVELGNPGTASFPPRDPGLQRTSPKWAPCEPWTWGSAPEAGPDSLSASRLGPWGGVHRQVRGAQLSAPRAPAGASSWSGHGQWGWGGGVPCWWGLREQVPGFCRKRGHLRSPVLPGRGWPLDPVADSWALPPNSVMWTTASPEVGAEGQGGGAARAGERGCSWRILGAEDGGTQGASRGFAPGRVMGGTWGWGPAGARAVVLPTLCLLGGPQFPFAVKGEGVSGPPPSGSLAADTCDPDRGRWGGGFPPTLGSGRVGFWVSQAPEVCGHLRTCWHQPSRLCQEQSAPAVCQAHLSLSSSLSSSWIFSPPLPHLHLFPPPLSTERPGAG